MRSDGAAKERILVVDDDPGIRRLVRHSLEKGGYQVVEAEDGEKAKQAIHDDIPVVVLDIQMPHVSGLDCLRYIRTNHQDTHVIMLSAIDQVDVVVEAMKLGAFWYLTKQSLSDELVPLVGKAVRHSQLARENRQLRLAVGSARLPVKYVGASSSAKVLLERVEKISQLDSTVLITGESGTGKSLLARMIHEMGPRADKPFVIVSCAALPRDLLEAELFGYERGAFTGAVSGRPGRIEIADGGTLFLDEIGDMALELQPKLLVFLQDRIVQRIGSNKIQNVDVRIISATHQDLQKMCEERKFREDLFFRINVLSLDAPPLRDRLDDVIEIAESHLDYISLRRSCPPFNLTPDALDVIKAYHWPGNVRELENVLERATAFCKDNTITAEDLSLGDSRPMEEAGVEASLAGRTLQDLEGQAIIDTLRQCKGNKAAAARMLGISEKSIYNKIDRLGLADEIASIVD